MPRLTKKHLPHRVDITAEGALTASGVRPGETQSDRPAYVEQKARLVVDRRAESPTRGQEITSSTFVVLLLEDDALPGADVTVWKGLPRERTSQVVASDYFEYRGTPSHVELYLE